METAAKKRWKFLFVGFIALLFAGIIYAWSILKAPLAAEFGWQASPLALNFTLTMCFFCIGGIIGSRLNKKAGVKAASAAAAVLSMLGFVFTAMLGGSSVVLLYLSYGVLAGTGIGIAYNVILSTVGQWFPDKKGLCTGVMMMGFGSSSLVIGGLAQRAISAPGFGWRKCFIVIGVALGVVIFAAGLILRNPPEGAFAPAVNKKADGAEKSYTTGEMLRTRAFWSAFFCIVFVAAVGNTMISFARDFALSVGAQAAAATTLVGVLSVCNGLGRIITGAVFDKLGCRKTMLLANALTIAAAALGLLAVVSASLVVCVIAVCLTGISYGSCPTMSSAFTADYFGPKYFPGNFSVFNFNIMLASFIATFASVLLGVGGSYVLPFVMLLALSVAAMFINISIRRPK